MKRRAVADPVNLACKKYSKFHMINDFSIYDVFELVEAALYNLWAKK